MKFALLERDDSVLCVLESVTDLFAMERDLEPTGGNIMFCMESCLQSEGWTRELNIESLRAKVEGNKVREVILALGNDMEGEGHLPLPEGSGYRGIDRSGSRESVLACRAEET